MGRETYLRSGAKRKSKKFQKHRSEIKPKNSMKFRRGKDFPIKNVKADPFFKPKKLAPRSKVSRPAVKHSRKLSKLRSRKANQAGLNASDLWMLNSASNQFSKTMRKHGRQGRHEDMEDMDVMEEKEDQKQPISNIKKEKITD